jgi:hypothetical protein
LLVLLCLWLFHLDLSVKVVFVLHHELKGLLSFLLDLLLEQGILDPFLLDLFIVLLDVIDGVLHHHRSCEGILRLLFLLNMVCMQILGVFFNLLQEVVSDLLLFDFCKVLDELFVLLDY